MTPENVRVSTRTELPRENVLPCPLKEELLEKVPDSPLPSELGDTLSCLPSAAETRSGLPTHG